MYSNEQSCPIAALTPWSRSVLSVYTMLVMLVPSKARATFPAADSHAETPNKMTKKAAKRLMMPSRLDNFLHCIMIEVVEELECEPVVHAHLWLPNIPSGRIRRDSEGCDMISIHGWDHESVVVDLWIAAQVA